MNEKKQMLRWDQQVEHEEYLRGDKGLVTAREAAEILGLTLFGFHNRVRRGKVVASVKDTGGIYGLCWYKRSELSLGKRR